MKGTKVQNVYNSHICPKYPNAAERKFDDLKTVNAALKSIADFDCDFRGTNNRINNPPVKASKEVNKRTFCQFKSCNCARRMCGNAVPNTNAPTKNPRAFPSFPGKFSAAIFIPTG